VRKHQERHPVLVEGCYACELLTKHLAPSAMGSRSAIEIVGRDKQWDVDMAAYKRLRADGVQPRSVDGAAVVEREATHEMEIKMGRTFNVKNKDAKFREGNDISREIGMTV
jgi:hypothetical protein